jgi:hypothetical protein
MTDVHRICMQGVLSHDILLVIPYIMHGCTSGPMRHQLRHVFPSLFKDDLDPTLVQYDCLDRSRLECVRGSCKVDVPIPILEVPDLRVSSYSPSFRSHSPYLSSLPGGPVYRKEVVLTRLYSIPPAAACNTHPTLASAPKIPVTIDPRAKEAMVLMSPAEPVAINVSLAPRTR